MTYGAHAVSDADYQAAQDRLIPQVVDTLQEKDEWYAEQDGANSIILITPLGKFELVFVQRD